MIRASEIIGASVPRLSETDSMPARWIDLTVQIKRAGQARRRLLQDVTSAPTDEAALVRRLEVVSAMGRAVEGFEAVADAIQTVIVTES